MQEPAHDVVAMCFPGWVDYARQRLYHTGAEAALRLAPAKAAEAHQICHPCSKKVANLVSTPTTTLRCGLACLGSTMC